MKFNDALKNYGLLLFIIAAGAMLRFYQLDFQSVWHDEIVTLNEAHPQFSLSELYTCVLENDPHPPLYFILIHYVFKIFGYTTYVMRAFSAVTGTLTIFGIFLLGREMFSRKVGIYAAALLAINYFHIYYSQEGRMYALLSLMAIFSFYYLVRFIKQPGIKSCIFYAIATTLMIYSHLFGLFTLCSQFAILGFFVVKPYNVTRIKFIGYCFISGFITVLLYLPTLSIFKKAAERTSIWIPMPTIDVYTQMFKDFFGGSEIVIFFSAILAALFIFKALTADSKEKWSIDPQIDLMVFGSLVLFSWIMITLLLPLIRTYTALPILINRYFIIILPAVILIIAVGLSYIKNNLLVLSFLLFITVFSVTDIFVVKKYYKTVAKTQWRELTSHIIEKNIENLPVVSRLGWFMPYFLNNEKIKMTIITEPLQQLVDEMNAGKKKPFSFWYIDGHGEWGNLNTEQKIYMDENFVTSDSLLVYNGFLRLYNKK